MNAILKKLEQKFRAASAPPVPGSCLGVDLNRGRGEAAPESCLDGDENRGQGVVAHQERGEGAKPVAKAEPESWKDSEPVSLLAAFMKEYRFQGFYLCRNEAGHPVLHMEPGVSPKEPERWDLALHAEHLMAEALKDLTRFLETGALNLKEVEVVKMRLSAPAFSPEQKICCTTVPGALVKLKAEFRLQVVRDALTYEQTHTNRPAMVKVIRERLRELEETSGGKAPLNCSTQGEFF